jgi:hypothetical protein
MRSFLRQHSSLYQWAVGPDERAGRALLHDLKVAHENAERAARDHHLAFAAATERHNEEVSHLKEAHRRVLRVNRDLVSALRTKGVTAEEYPAQKCPHCGSLAAMPEEGHHQIGITDKGGLRYRAFCDGEEELAAPFVLS